MSRDLTPVLFAMDPSIDAFGWCVLRLDPDGPDLVGAGVITTKPTPKKRRPLVAIDDARRARFIRRELCALLDRYAPSIVAIEAGFGSQSARAAKLLGSAQTLAAIVCDERLGGEPVYVTVHDAGNALGLDRTQRVAESAKSVAAKALQAALVCSCDDLREPLADCVKHGSSEQAAAAREEAEKTAKRAANRARARSKKARKGSIAQAVVERLGAHAWAHALNCAATDDALLAPKWEGAHDAAAIALAAWDRPEVAAIRDFARQQQSA